LTPVPDDHPPDPLAVVTDAEAEMPLPSNPRTFFLGGIFALSVFATLYLASSIILPVVLAFVLTLLLQPAVRLLERVHLPRAVGALLIVLLAIGTLVGLVAGHPRTGCLASTVGEVRPHSGADQDQVG
jgi:hypothetical protein